MVNCNLTYLYKEKFSEEREEEEEQAQSLLIITHPVVVRGNQVSASKIRAQVTTKRAFSTESYLGSNPSHRPRKRIILVTKGPICPIVSDRYCLNIRWNLTLNVLSAVS